MLPTAPVTSAYVARGSITVRELCATVVEVSDNPAANLLLNLIGGPGFTQSYAASTIA
jgi:beta-lactamase class A